MTDVPFKQEAGSPCQERERHLLREALRPCLSAFKFSWTCLCNVSSYAEDQKLWQTDCSGFSQWEALLPLLPKLANDKHTYNFTSRSLPECFTPILHYHWNGIAQDANTSEKRHSHSQATRVGPAESLVNLGSGGEEQKSSRRAASEQDLFFKLVSFCD